MNEQIIIKAPDKSGKQRVYLILPEKSYKSTRQIGYIRDNTFYTYRSPEHIFKKLNAIGLNYQLLKRGGFDFISIQFGNDTLETSREYFLENGEFLYFKNNGLDRQIFLKLSLFSPEKQKEWNLKKIEKTKSKLTEFGGALVGLSNQIKLF